MSWLHKNCACLLIALCWSGFVQAQIHLSGHVSGVLTDTTYIVDGDIMVPRGDSLVIQPGAAFEFDGYYALYIMGYLYAVGTEHDSIGFLTWPIHDWKGIRFGGSWGGATAGSQISYARIEGADCAVIIDETNQISISHSTILRNSLGIHCQLSDNLVIDHCDLVENLGGMILHANTLDFDGCSNAQVTNCRLLDNFGTEYYAQGGIVWLKGGSTFMTNCLLRGCWCWGDLICISYLGSLHMTNCSIVENTWPADDAIQQAGSLNPTWITNCIVRNENLIGIEISGPTPVVEYCNVRGGYPGAGNFDADPLFVAGPTGQREYYLSQIAAGDTVNSPCINSGHPYSTMITGTTRTDGVQDSGIVDIGFHYPLVVGVRGLGSSLPSDEIHPSSFIFHPSVPNPFNASTAISFKLQAASHVSLKVYDTAGRLVFTLVDGWREAGSHEVTFDGSGLTSGLYFVKMQAGENAAVQKVLLLK